MINSELGQEGLKTDIYPRNTYDLLIEKNVFFKMVLKTVVFWKFCKIFRNILNDEVYCLRSYSM